MAVLPVQPRWVSCAGSELKYRGYPCALWTLLHIVTIHCLPLVHYTDHNVVRPQYRSWSTHSLEALRISRQYVVNFFTCEHCREHFKTISMDIETAPMDDVSAILWLWRAHNSVNKRLASDISTDPVHPKVQFPNRQLCQKCSVPLNNGSVEWNHTAVLLFLFDFYGMGKIDINNTKSRTYIRGQLVVRSSVDRDRHYPWPVVTSPFSITDHDISLCFLVYVLIAMILLMFFLRLYYKRRRRKLPKFVV